MHNSQKPNVNELPSSAQLLKSTCLAFVVAVALLLSTILPAEYGIDPTGLGRAMGLTQMGEIKQSLAEEAEADAHGSSVDRWWLTPTRLLSGVADLLFPSAYAHGDEGHGDEDSDESEHSLSYTLKNNQAIEVKLVMDEGARVSYRWQAEGGAVNFDLHGDNSDIDYHRYSKGRKVSEDSGELEAAFSGNHGWFWRNRSGQEVTITLEISGEYSEVKRVK